MSSRRSQQPINYVLAWNVTKLLKMLKAGRGSNFELI